MNLLIMVLLHRAILKIKWAEAGETVLDLAGVGSQLVPGTIQFIAIYYTYMLKA